jgi:hypothetical protein
MEAQYQEVLDSTLPSLSSGNVAGGASSNLVTHKGVWKTLPMSRVGHGSAISITASGLRPATAYLFRCVPLCVSRPPRCTL